MLGVPGVLGVSGVLGVFGVLGVSGVLDVLGVSGVLGVFGVLGVPGVLGVFGVLGVPGVLGGVESFSYGTGVSFDGSFGSVIDGGMYPFSGWSGSTGTNGLPLGSFGV